MAPDAALIRSGGRSLWRAGGRQGGARGGGEQGGPLPTIHSLHKALQPRQCFRFVREDSRGYTGFGQGDEKAGHRHTQT
jgi:hypothetical protein